MDWASILANYGFGVAVIAALGWFGAYRIWPFYKDQVKANQETRERMLNGFHDSLTKRDAEFGKIVTALQDLTDEIRGRRTKR